MTYGVWNRGEISIMYNSLAINLQFVLLCIYAAVRLVFQLTCIADAQFSFIFHSCNIALVSNGYKWILSSFL